MIKAILVERRRKKTITIKWLFSVCCRDAGAQISWETDEPAKGEIIWDVTDKLSKDSKFIIGEKFTKTHSFKITGLSPSTLYYYWAASGDAKNNWKISEPATFKTLAK